MLEKAPDNRQLLMKYAGMAFQFVALIGAAVWAGWFIDKKIASSIPLFTWLLPLLFIVGLIIKAVTDTNRNNNNKRD